MPEGAGALARCYLLKMLRVRSLVHSEVVHNDDDDDDDDDDGEQWPWQARNDDHVPTEAPCTTPPDHKITLHNAVASPLPVCVQHVTCAQTGASSCPTSQDLPGLVRRKENQLNGSVASSPPIIAILARPACTRSASRAGSSAREGRRRGRGLRTCERRA